MWNEEFKRSVIPEPCGNKNSLEVALLAPSRFWLSELEGDHNLEVLH